MEDLQTATITIHDKDQSLKDPTSMGSPDLHDQGVIEDGNGITGDSGRNEESIHSIHGGPCPCDHQFSMNVADYQLGAVIGFGSSAIVYMAKYLPLSMDVAIKMIELDQFERNRIDELRKEIQVMAFCKHPNLLGNLTSFVHESKLWIVTPFLAGGSCLDIMKSGFKDGFDEAIIATILVQALQGLEYLHENGHIHRDVKCGNLLMSEDGLVQLADFGVSSSLMEDGERHGVRKTYVGTPCWMAPEVMEITRGYDFKADIWSFGITALELAYGHAPYAKFPPMKVIYLTLSGKPPTLDKKQTSRKYSRMFKDMIDCCLQRDPAKRPTAKALLKHPFFRSMAKKPQYLVANVLVHVPPVNLRDKSAQLRARGLPVPVPAEESPQEANGNNSGGGVSGGEAAATTPNKSSFLGQFVASVGGGFEDHHAEKNEDSWDFSIDNSVDPEDGSSIPAPASVFDVIAEEDEEGDGDGDDEDADDSGNDDGYYEEDDEKDKVPVPVEEEISIQSDFLPDARLIEHVESADVSFNGLQKSRTSRFILAAEEAVSEAMNRLDLSMPVVVNSVDHQDEIVGSVGDLGESVGDAPAGQIIGSHSSAAYRSSSPNETGSEGTAATNEVKKGRFSVLEAVNVSDVDPSIDGGDGGAGHAHGGLLDSGAHIMSLSGSSPNNSASAMEEEKRSRFEVSLNVPAADTSDTEDPNNNNNNNNNNNSNNSNQLPFESSAEKINAMYHPQQQFHHHNNNSIHQQSSSSMGPGYPQAPTQFAHFNGPAFYPPSVYPHPQHHPMTTASTPLFQHQHRPSLTSMPFYPSSASPGHLPSMSPVSATHIDHLLHVNDYLRNQIIELKYRQDWMQIQIQQQQQQHQQQQSSGGMRPHSTFNPHISGSNSGPASHFNNYAGLSGGPQLHHSHPVMPPAALSSDAIHPSHPADFAFNHHASCYCCPPPSSQASQSNHQLVSISNSVSPAPADSSVSSSANAANIAAILKELDSMKKENDILKAYLHQQHQQQQQQ